MHFNTQQSIIAHLSFSVRVRVFFSAFTEPGFPSRTIAHASLNVNNHKSETCVESGPT